MVRELEEAKLAAKMVETNLPWSIDFVLVCLGVCMTVFAVAMAKDTMK